MLICFGQAEGFNKGGQSARSIPVCELGACEGVEDSGLLEVRQFCGQACQLESFFGIEMFRMTGEKEGKVIEGGDVFWRDTQGVLIVIDGIADLLETFTCHSRLERSLRIIWMNVGDFLILDEGLFDLARAFEQVRQLHCIPKVVGCEEGGLAIVLVG